MSVTSSMQIIANSDDVLRKSAERLDANKFDAASLNSADTNYQQSFLYFMTCALATYSHALPGTSPLEEIYHRPGSK